MSFLTASFYYYYYLRVHNSTKPGECVSGDIVPIHAPTHDGSTMFFLSTDVAAGFMMAFTAKAKNAFLTTFVNVVKTSWTETWFSI